MRDAVFTKPDRTAHDKATSKAGKLLAMARMGCAASDSVLDIDLSDDGYTPYFETMASIADALFADLGELQNKPQQAPTADTNSQEGAST